MNERNMKTRKTAQQIKTTEEKSLIDEWNTM